jgi:hypothetical protein
MDDVIARRINWTTKPAYTKQPLPREAQETGVVAELRGRFPGAQPRYH